MQAPKCKLCGERHWGACAVRSTHKPDMKDELATLRKQVEALKAEAENRPMTNAERQRRYRERHGDAYRKANRERMRRKRNDKHH